MTRQGGIVLEKALALSAGERAEIASALLESLKPEPEVEIDAAWRQEVAARIAALDAGEAETTPWESVLERFRSRLDERAGTVAPALEERIRHKRIEDLKSLLGHVELDIDLNVSRRRARDR